MRRIYPEEASEVDLATAYAYPPTPWVRANMVASVDGAASIKRVSGGLSGKADRRLLGLLRGLADVIVVGASTVRVEGYGPARPRDAWRRIRDELGRTAAPPIAVVTGHLDLDLTSPLFTEAEPSAPTILITTEVAAADADRRDLAAKHAEVVIAGEEHVEMGEAIAALADRGLTHVLCEGGPRLLAGLAAADRLDELCLTISPLLASGDDPRILSGDAHLTQLRLVQVLEDEGFLFCQYQRSGR